MPNVTSNPTRDRLDGTQRKTRRGNRSRFSRVNRLHRMTQAVENVTEILTFKVVGTHTVRVDPGFPFRPYEIELPTVEVKDSRLKKRTGKKRHKQAPALPFGPGCHIAPIANFENGEALKAVEKVKREQAKKDNPGEAKNVRILTAPGIKNKHSVDAPTVDMTQRAAKVVDSSPETWRVKRVTMTKIGVTKFHDATIQVSNGEFSKSIIIRRVKSERQALHALEHIHGIK